MSGRGWFQIAGIVVVGLMIVAVLTAVLVAPVPTWAAILARVGVGIDAATTGLLVNRLVARRRLER